MPLFFLFLQSYCYHRDLHSFPTRRSSDLPVVPFPPVGEMLAFALRKTSLVKDNFRTGALLGENYLRSEEHTSELQSRLHLVCRLLLEKKKTNSTISRNQQSSTITHSIQTL